MADQILVSSMRKILGCLSVKNDLTLDADMVTMCDNLIKINTNELRGIALASFRNTRNKITHEFKIENVELFATAIGIMKTWYLTLCSHQYDFNTETELLVFDLLLYSLSNEIKGNALKAKMGPPVQQPPIFEHIGPLGKLAGIMSLGPYKIYLMSGRNATKVCKYSKSERNNCLVSDLHTGEFFSVAKDVKVGLVRHYTQKDTKQLTYKGNDFIPPSLDEEEVDEQEVEEEEVESSDNLPLTNVINMTSENFTDTFLPQFVNVKLIEVRDTEGWREKLKGRKLRIMDGKRKGMDAIFYGWNGTAAYIQLYHDNTRLSIGIIHNISIYATQSELLQ